LLVAALLVLVFDAALEVVREVVVEEAVELSASGSSSSFSVTTVAVVHVVVDARAVLTASVFSCNEVI
jgi:hypothetical protein